MSLCGLTWVNGQKRPVSQQNITKYLNTIKSVYESTIVYYRYLMTFENISSSAQPETWRFSRCSSQWSISTRSSEVNAAPGEAMHPNYNVWFIDPTHIEAAYITLYNWGMFIILPTSWHILRLKHGVEILKRILMRWRCPQILPRKRWSAPVVHKVREDLGDSASDFLLDVPIHWCCQITIYRPWCLPSLILLWYYLGGFPVKQLLVQCLWTRH